MRHVSLFDLTYLDASEAIEACGEPSPSGRMLCDLPASVERHPLSQHLGLDMFGNLRGWADRRDA